MTAGTMRYRCNCGAKLYVTETRATQDAIWRTRKCRECDTLFTTVETAVDGLIPKEARPHRDSHHRKTRQESGDPQEKNCAQQ
jgi:transcriptional regulator NrdR family protein